MEKLNKLVPRIHPVNRIHLAAATARQFTVGANWYPASVMKYYLTYERTAFDGGTAPARADENVRSIV